ncbi:amidase signature (AS) enzyme-5 [Coleophoma crateriformis]|uniref:Amidase signature (AS) enzyme-5 n=1 Tax=Coleophoma crateriformis TaxID=565419 RepID=A0A3D8RCU9_9HELO|nr:amidase signature (AS) enzyme-5 [Coleophoma crateriformis]
MAINILEAGEADAELIAAIHLAAFDSNILLHAQFPTSTALASLQTILAEETKSSIRDPTKTVLIAKQYSKVIGFAKWDLPTHTKIPFEDIVWPDDADHDYLDQYANKAEAAKGRVTSDEPCYRLTFVGVEPKHQGKGIGTLLTKWGLQKAQSENVPVYLESTIAASNVYRRLGFVVLDGFSMKVPGRGETRETVLYEELCMLRTWDDEELDHWDSSLDISSLRLDYEAGIKPQHVVQAIYERIEAYKENQPSVWLYLRPMSEVMQEAMELTWRFPEPTDRPPLWGIPFSVKDSINVRGVPTTIGCPPLAFTPEKSAKVFLDCQDSGALFIGKTNMEQLATGMTGCRSPYGTLHSTFSDLHSVGGSSSGSAVSVSEGLVSFSLGSDTAGSIRVPAAFNGIVGFKPTKGTISASGVYPACMHQDCVSFLTLTTGDAEQVWRETALYDKNDHFAKPSTFPRPKYDYSQKHGLNPAQSPINFRFGTPPESALDACTPTYRELFRKATEVLQAKGGKSIDTDWTIFSAANDLLYNSSFVLERLTIMPDGWFETNKDLLHPVIKQVFESAIARKTSATEVFRDLHAQAKYKRAVEDILTFSPDPDSPGEEAVLTVMVVPTTPFHPTIAEIEKDPLGINGKLGTFAHFGNVLDLCAIAIPAGAYVEDGVRLPFSITILAGCGLDEELLSLGRGLEDFMLDLGDD